MKHILIRDGAPTPYSVGQLRRDNPSVSFPDAPSGALLAEWGVHPVAIEPRPEIGDTETARPADTPVQHADGTWTLGWIVEPRPREQVIAAIKAEARRRILAICPEWKQQNLTARAVELTRMGEASWTEAEAAEWAAGEVIWATIKAIRAASDALEAADPIPGDFRADVHWPAN